VSLTKTPLVLTFETAQYYTPSFLLGVNRAYDTFVPLAYKVDGYDHLSSASLLRGVMMFFPEVPVIARNTTGSASSESTGGIWRTLPVPVVTQGEVSESLP
jgi:hypothetical protein